MSTTVLPSAAPTTAPVKPRRAPLAVLIAAWAVPTMVVGGFAFLAYIPLAVVVIGVLLAPRRRRALGWWTHMEKVLAHIARGVAAGALRGRIYTRRKS